MTPPGRYTPPTNPTRKNGTDDAAGAASASSSVEFKWALLRQTVWCVETVLYVGITCWAIWDVFASEAKVSSEWGLDALVRSPPHRRDIRTYSGLERGWLSRYRDSKDTQLRHLREHFLEIIAVVVVWSVAKIVINGLLGRLCTVPHAQQTARRRMMLDLGLSFAAVVYLHEAFAFVTVLVIFCSYFPAKFLFVGKQRFGWIGIWALNVGVLLATRFGPSSDQIATAMGQIPVTGSGSMSGAIRFLSQFRGEIGWTSTVHFVVLRLISFELDLHWALSRKNELRFQGVVREQSRCAQETADISEGQPMSSPDANGVPSTLIVPVESSQALMLWKQMAGVSLPIEEYSVVGLLAFCFYLPVFATGPMNSFNVYAHCRRAKVDRSSVVSYRAMFFAIARWLALAAILEVFVHFWYPSAIMYNLVPTLNARFFHCCSGKDLLYLWYVTIVFLWLKFSVIWGAARVWAAADGVVTVDNMPTFVNSIHTPAQFWKSWHASFHAWLVRYLYAPVVHVNSPSLSLHAATQAASSWRRCGGTVLVFAFVGAWHEVSLQMIVWAVVCALIVSIDNSCRTNRRASTVNAVDSANRSRQRNFCKSLLHRYGIAGIFSMSILLLIMGNVVAYGYKPNVHNHQLSDIMEATLLNNTKVILEVLAYLFAAAQSVLLLQAREQSQLKPTYDGTSGNTIFVAQNFLRWVEATASTVGHVALRAWPLLPAKVPTEHQVPQTFLDKPKTPTQAISLSKKEQ